MRAASIESVAGILLDVEAHRVCADMGPSITAKAFGITVLELEEFVGKNADLLQDRIAFLKKEASERAVSRCKQRQRKDQADPASRIINSVRAHVWYAIKTGRASKKTPTFRILGYGPKDLIGHLTPMLRPGMTWANYGRVWHVDHKRPVSSFNFSVDCEETVRQCWALSNLQPLFAVENMSKGNRHAGS